MKKRMVIEIEFEEERDEFDPDYTYIEFSSMRVREDETTVSEEDRARLAESWAQSDWYSVGFTSAFLSLFDGDEIDKADVRPY